MQELPRGPIYKDPESSAKPDYTEQYTDGMLQWRDEAYREAVRFRRMCPEENRVQTHMKYIEGNHWDQFGRRAAFKSKFYINKTGAARLNHLSILTDTRPDIEITATVPEHKAIAEINDGVIRKEWMNNDMDLSLVSVTDIATVTGTGFWKIGGAAPGMMNVMPCGPDMVMPIQPGFHLQQSTAVLYRTWKPEHWVIAKFPMHADKIMKEGRANNYIGQESQYQKPDYLDQWTWQAMAPQFRRMLSRANASPIDTVARGYFRSVEWQEYYIDDMRVNNSTQEVVMRDPFLSPESHNWWYVVKPGERLYPRKRLVIFAGNALIYDGPAPYWHGLYPFACLRLNPVFWNFWGLSKYRDMVPVNCAINEVIAGALDLIKQALMPTVIAKTSSISAEAWRQYFPGMPGAKIAITNPLANVQQDIQFSQPPNIPAYVFQVLQQYLGPEFDKLSGMMDMSSLYGKKQVPGGDTIEQMRDSVQGPYRLEGRYIETFLRDAGLQALSHVLQFYSFQRRMELIGASGISHTDFDKDPFTLIPANMNKFDFWKQFPLTVAPGSMHGGAKDRHKLLMIQLFSLGAISRGKLLQELEIDDISDEELQAQMPQMAGPGGTPRLSRGQRNGSPV